MKQAEPLCTREYQQRGLDCRFAGWSVSLLFIYNCNGFSHDLHVYNYLDVNPYHALHSIVYQIKMQKIWSAVTQLVEQLGI